MAGSRDALRRAVVDVLGTGALPTHEIVRELRARSVDVDRERVERMLADDTSFTEAEAGVAHVPSLLEGTAWTVWVDADDARQGFLRTHPHLDAMSWWLLEDRPALVTDDGARLGRLHVDSRWLDDIDTDVVLGPDGWLDDLAGGWATVRIDDGALHWSKCEHPPQPTVQQVATIRVGFEAAMRVARSDSHERPLPPELAHAVGDNPIHEALIADREPFVEAQIPPLPSLYEAAGLECHRATIAERGFDWDGLERWRARNRLAFTYGLDDEQVDRLQIVVGACGSWMAEGVEALGANDDERQGAAVLLAVVLEDGELGDAFWDECALRGMDPGDLVGFVDELLARLGDEVPVGLAWVRARGLELTGDTATALAHLEQTVTADCDHGPALTDLAAYRADQGDAAAALALLRRAGASEPTGEEDDGFGEPDEAALLMEEVGGFALHRPRPAAGRNDRCPCGSGRKYKVCHLGQERHPLEDRAGWLWEKAARFARRHAPELLAELAAEMADPIDAPLLFRQLRRSPWTVDLALHEGGHFADFLASRNELLPDDEALLASQWALTGRAVLEVRRIEPGTLELHDIGRGERVTVANTTPSERTRRGVVLLGRPLPVAADHRAFSGFVEVPRSKVTDVLDAIDDGDAFAIAAAVGDTLRPPRMSNSDGQDLVLHTMRWRCPHPERIDVALRAAGFTGEEDGSSWTLVRDSLNQPNTLIASVRLDGDELIVEVNSDERAAELRALVERAVPDAELLDDDERSLEEALDDFEPDERHERPDLQRPELRDVLAQVVAGYEQKWLDESIPALGGRTPREAALDPIGREELEHLLDTFPEPGADDIAAMSPARLRSALQL